MVETTEKVMESTVYLGEPIFMSEEIADVYYVYVGCKHVHCLAVAKQIPNLGFGTKSKLK